MNIFRNKITSLFIFIILASLLSIFSSEKKIVREANTVMEEAKNLVRELKPTPTQSSRFYAVIATEYYMRKFENKSADSPLLGILNTDKKLPDFSKDNQKEILKEIINQEQSFNSKVRLLKGIENWVGEKPFSPGASLLPRFVIDNNFTYQVPPPPKYVSKEFSVYLENVKNTSDRRTPAQNALINFWGGVPGTQAPAGIWLDRFHFYSKKYKLSDKEYAKIQMIMAQGVADSFMECWKVKYTYQTKRPNMTDKNIVVAMPNPPFPSYVSGHSTISFTAATILSKYFINDRDALLNEAEQAKNSRLNAGIHFEYDNEEGKKLGIKIGEFVNQVK